MKSKLAFVFQEIIFKDYYDLDFHIGPVQPPSPDGAPSPEDGTVALFTYDTQNNRYQQNELLLIWYQCSLQPSIGPFIKDFAPLTAVVLL